MLSREKWNFLTPPPDTGGPPPPFELLSRLPAARALLRTDPQLERMRFALVPHKITEEVHNLFMIILLLTRKSLSFFFLLLFFFSSHLVGLLGKLL
jgi:hypothetical protein